MINSKLPTNIKIVDDITLQDEYYKITPVIAKELQKLGVETMVNMPSKKTIDKLLKTIQLYPHVPHFKNYLANVYNKLGFKKEELELSKSILNDHPEYLYAKLNFASILIDNGELEDASDILSKEMHLSSLYPNRDTFHISEVLSFYLFAVKYFVAKEDLNSAMDRMAILRQYGPNETQTNQASKLMMSLVMKGMTEKFEEEERLRIKPQKIMKVEMNASQEEPQFNYPNINQLYQYGLNIDIQIIEQILELPRETLIKDLESILIDAVNRYSYFVDNEELDESLFLVIHVLSLLKEIGATESLPRIFEFLSYEYDFIDFWLGGYKTEALWQVIYTLGFNNLNLLKDFLLKPNVDTYSKIAVCESLAQIVLHHPERREEVLMIFQEVFEKFESAQLEDGLVDSELLGFAVSEVLDSNLFELLPIIKKLYDKEIVALHINGDYQDVVGYFKTIDSSENEKEVLNIFELYQEYKEFMDDDDFEEDESFQPYHKPINIPAVSIKIGRNDPCPCGSGKKYKKCCIDKE